MTLTELYTTRTENLEQAIESLQTQIESTQSSKNAQQIERQFWIDRIATRESELEDAETAIAATSTIAEIEAIAASMRELKIDRRASQAKLNLMQRSLSVSESTLSSLVNTLDQLTTQLSESNEALAEAQAIDEKHQAWIDSVGIDPLASIPTDADNLLTTTIDPALDKLKNATSDAFVDMLSERLTHHWDELDDLATRSDALTTVNDATIALQLGRDGEIRTKLRVYETAVTQLSEFVANSQALLDSASATADRIQASDLLNSVQKAYFDSLMSVGDIDADVLTPESELRVAEHELLIRIRELETARAIARAADPDIEDSDLDVVAEVKAILDGTDGKDAIADMQTAYDDAVAAVGGTSFDTVIEKEAALQLAHENLATETAAFLEDNPDQDPDAAAELDDARDAVTDAQAELNAAQSDMKDSPWFKLEQLEVAIPSDTWIDALYLLNSQRQLNQLKSIDPNDLASAVTAAADALATALDIEISSDDGIAIAQQQIDQYQNKFNNIAAKGTESALDVAFGVL